MVKPTHHQHQENKGLRLKYFFFREKGNFLTPGGENVNPMIATYLPAVDKSDLPAFWGFGGLKNVQK